MATDATTVSVHSLVEAHLYISIHHCPVCGKGPLEERSGPSLIGPSNWSVDAECTACHHFDTLRFHLDPATEAPDPDGAVINPTGRPSMAIDLREWLTLSDGVLAASRKEPDRERARQLAFRAAQCLDEALRFFEDDNELPPATAFFTEASRRRFQNHPEQFLQSRLRERRLHLPDVRVRLQTESNDPFWRLWRRRP